MPPQSVYIHIPFCTNKCYYCDFNSFVTREPRVIGDYLEALDREMARTFAEHPPERVRTVFVGGGTPTYLNHAQMRQFLETVEKHLGPWFDADLEYTMEANPGTVDREKLALMRSFGVNRLSLGVQSFDPSLLKRLGRIHDVEDVCQSIDDAVAVGFVNLSIDLMFGLPDQTQELFAQSLEQALALPIVHLSAYSLKVEENTLFHTLYEKGQLPLPSEEEELAMYLQLIDTMESNGFPQYEISNFARPGWECRHNQTYWLNEEYYGIGAGAHGYVAGWRHVNAGPIPEYLRLSREGLPRVESFAVGRREAMEDHMILGLRLRKGVDLEQFRRRFGRTVEEEFGDVIQREKDNRMLEEVDGHLRLTKRALPLGNEVFMQFLR